MFYSIQFRMCTKGLLNILKSQFFKHSSNSNNIMYVGFIDLIDFGHLCCDLLRIDIRGTRFIKYEFYDNFIR